MYNNCIIVMSLVYMKVYCSDYSLTIIKYNLAVCLHYIVLRSESSVNRKMTTCVQDQDVTIDMADDVRGWGCR